MTPEFRKREIFENIEAGDGFGRPKSRIFFAGANFIALRRHGSYFKCLVEWLHRREIAPAGAIAHTIPLVQSIVFRSLDWIFAIGKNESRTSFENIQIQYY